MIGERGRMAWQKASSYNLRAKVEASIGRYKRVIGDALRSRTDQTEATEVAIAAAALNRMLGLGRPNLCPYRLNNVSGWRYCVLAPSRSTSMQHSPGRSTLTQDCKRASFLFGRACSFVRRYFGGCRICWRCGGAGVGRRARAKA